MTASTTSAPAQYQRSLRFIIIGAGLSGVMSAIKLKQAGYSDIVIYEKADRPGGTWRENTYPGVACDIPSHLYSYSFAPNPEWSHRYSPGSEIQAYIENVVRQFNVEQRIRYSQEIARCEFSGGQWHVETKTGYRDVADVIIAATGVLHHPNEPDIPGRDSFTGAIFHSARWDHSAKVDGRRVGVIGAGSTAVQLVSALATRVSKLALLQRTPQWILPQDNSAYSTGDIAKFRAQPESIRGMRAEVQRRFCDNFSNAVVDASSAQMKVIEDMCREHLETQVKDVVLREKLRPQYRAGCKRLVVSGDFYRAVQHPNVRVITNAIKAIEPTGIRTRDDELHELDVIVLATGFHTDRFIRPAEVIGRNEQKLSERWATRPNAYLSVAIPDFPNFFMLNGPNSPVGNFSLIEVAEQQMEYALQLIAHLRDGTCREISPTHEGMAAFESERVAATKKTIWTTGCNSWYLDDRGVPAAWPWTFDRFRAEMTAPKLEAYEQVR